MTNFEYYKEELIKLGKTSTFFEEPFIELYKRYGDLPSFCNEHIIEWLYDEHKEPILTAKEKMYLEGVLSPFKDRVNYVAKVSENIYSFIQIEIKPIDCGVESIELPYFKPNVMYKNMELNKEYTLEELGLFDE